MTIPYVPMRLVPKLKYMDFITYLLLNIEWNKQIRDEAFNDFDRRWKQGQIDLLQGIIDEMLGIDYDHMDKILLLMEEIKEVFDAKQ
jgi:hypothetical protein